MTSIPNRVSFIYQFLNDPSAISNKDRKNIPAILYIDATVTVKINDVRYFEADLAILEFYKALYMWKRETLTQGVIPEFHYYTIEYDDYEDGAILSLIPFSNKARLTSIWAEQNLYNVFDLDYIVAAFFQLEENLKRDIEAYFGIQLSKFIKHIP